MPANSSATRVLLFFVLSLFAVASAQSQAGQQVADKSPQSANTAAASVHGTEVGKYVGADTCKSCHEEIYNAWAKTPHWVTTLNKEGGPSKQGCEGCHGPGADHVAGGGDVSKIFTFKDVPAKEINARCMTCHAGGAAAHERHQLHPHAKQRQLHLLSFASPFGNQRVFAGESTA